MKKILLLSGLLVSGVLSSQAFEAPKVYPGNSFQGISPDGRYLCSSLIGNVTIYDLQTGVQYDYNADETGEIQYSEGLGNYVSNAGIILGSTSSTSDAAYWENGEWHQLSTTGVAGLSNLSNGITPDGSRICGCIGMSPISAQEDNLMMAPAYWDRMPDGSYGEYQMLPYPELDLTGRVPQYITAVSISDDGKVIIGQIVDCIGALNIPIVYIQDEKGDWNYKTLCDEFINPDKLTFPAYPGEGPSYPSVESYMSDEEKAAYDEAYQKYVDSGYDYSLYPNEIDFLSPENREAYDKALAEYEAKNDEWSAAFEAFMDVYYQVVETAPMFVFNGVRVSPDGKTYYTTAEVVDDSDPWAWPPKVTSTPWAINIEDDSVTKYEFDESLMIASVPNNDVVMLFNGVNALPMKGYILENGKLTPIEEYLGSFSPELKEWIDENMVYEIETGYDEETGEFLTEVACVTGMPLASADLKTVAVWNNDPAGFDYALGYVFNLSQFGGVKDAVIAGDNSVKFDAAGNIVVEGDVNALYLYDLNGRQILSVSNPAGTVECNVPAGIYVVKCATSWGSFSSKIAK